MVSFSGERNRKEEKEMNEKIWSYFFQVLKSESNQEEWSDNFSNIGNGFVSESGVACLPVRDESDLEEGESLSFFFKSAGEPWRILVDNVRIADGQIQTIIDGEELRQRLGI